MNDLMETNNSDPHDSRSGRSRAPVLIVIIAVICSISVIAAWSAGWIGRSGMPHVFITDFVAEVTDFPDCTATFNYILHNDGTAKAYVDIDYLDNGWVVAHDFYVVEAGTVKYVDYSIFHVACTGHNYTARVAAVS